MTQFEYYSHNDMRKIKSDLSNDQMAALKELLVERIVDNMSVEDLVEYVAMDLDKYYDDMLDQDFLAEAEDYWEDSFPDVIQEIQEDF
jgi:S-adenosylmethionine:diacylglycerol 3-amino-3-carboxypropyl transferase